MVRTCSNKSKKSIRYVWGGSCARTITRHCYWVEITRFDATERNDVLDSTRVPPIGSGAALAVGAFGYDPAAPGPGLVVTRVPEKYSGPLKLNDRILSVGGTHIKDAAGFAAYLSAQNEERALGVVVLRGKDRLRLESRIALAKREENVTARVRGEFMMDGRQLLLITRGVAAVRLDLPSFWMPCTINWNGNEAGTAETAGCWSVTAGAAAERCVGGGNQEEIPGSGVPPHK